MTGYDSWQQWLVATILVGTTAAAGGCQTGGVMATHPSLSEREENAKQVIESLRSKGSGGKQEEPSDLRRSR